MSGTVCVLGFTSGCSADRCKCKSLVSQYADLCERKAMSMLQPRHRKPGPAQLFMFHPDYVARHRKRADR